MLLFPILATILLILFNTALYESVKKQKYFMFLSETYPVMLPRTVTHWLIQPSTRKQWIPSHDWLHYVIKPLTGTSGLLRSPLWNKNTRKSSQSHIRRCNYLHPFQLLSLWIYAHHIWVHELVGCNHHLFLHNKNKRDGIPIYIPSTLPPPLFSTLDLNDKRNLNLGKAYQSQAGCAYWILNKKKRTH